MEQRVNKIVESIKESLQHPFPIGNSASISVNTKKETRDQPVIQSPRVNPLSIVSYTQKPSQKDSTIHTITFESKSKSSDFKCILQGSLSVPVIQKILGVKSVLSTYTYMSQKFDQQSVHVFFSKNNDDPWFYIFTLEGNKVNELEHDKMLKQKHTYMFIPYYTIKRSEQVSEQILDETHDITNIIDNLESIGGFSKGIKFNKNNKRFTRKVRTNKRGTEYVVFEGKHVPVSRLKVVT